MKTLKTLIVAELADVYDGEKRLVKSLPKMAKAATCKLRKRVILAQLEEAKDRVSKLEEVFASFIELAAKGETGEATAGFLKEAEAIAEEFKGSPSISAAAQKVEPSERTTYSCLHEWLNCLDGEKPLPASRRSWKRETAPTGITRRFRTLQEQH